MNAYDRIYLEDAMSNLAVMLDYGSIVYGNPEIIFERFLTSDISRQFEVGNPLYVSGMSGIELAERVIGETGGEPVNLQYRRPVMSAEYWAGWALAYIQWYTGLPFIRLKDFGVDVVYMISLYPAYHEADITKLVETVTQRIKELKIILPNSLKRQRMLAGMTQKELSHNSGVKLRMIQAYEQGYQDIRKAEVQSVYNLSRVLKCPIENLIY